MLKRKFLSVLLCFSMVFAFSFPSFSEGLSEECVVENDGISDVRTIAGQLAAEDNAITTEEKSKDSVYEDSFVFTAYVDPSLIYPFSDEILSGPTGELLSHYLDYLRMNMMFSSSLDGLRSCHFSDNPAFAELLTRDDLFQTLRNYESSLDSSEKTMEYLVFQEFVEQPAVKKTFDSTNLSEDLMVSSDLSATIGEYVGTINGIDYFLANIGTTVSGNAVQLLTPERELTSVEIANYNEYQVANFPGATFISSPTAYYNCHSYAWYLASSSNQYWIDDISAYTSDAICTPITAIEDVQANDIIVYCDYSRNVFLHSGIVDGIDSSGNIIVRSKWGAAGVYRHNLSYVPLEYTADYYTGLILVKFFRYHDYAKKFTGNEYHYGRRHYYEYADFCLICAKSDNPIWESSICFGPPCVIPFVSYDEEHDIA